MTKATVAVALLLAVPLLAACGPDDSTEAKAAIKVCEDQISPTLRKAWGPGATGDVLYENVKTTRWDHPGETIFEVTGKVGIFEFRCNGVTIEHGTWDGSAFFVSLGDMVLDAGTS